MEELPRRLEPITQEALSNFRVVMVTGPRQAGKTTLIRRTLGGAGTLACLDQEAILRAALEDSIGFAAFGNSPRAFDKVQRAGELVVANLHRAIDLRSRNTTETYFGYLQMTYLVLLDRQQPGCRATLATSR